MTVNTLVVADFAAEYPGAFVRSLRALGERLPAEDRLIFLFPRARPWQRSLRELGQVFVSRSPQWDRADRALTEEVYELCRRGRVSLIHTNFGLAAPLSASLVRRRLRIGHLWHWRSAAGSLDARGRAWRRAAPCAYRALAHGERVAAVAISRPLGAALCGRGFVRAQALHVVHNGVDLEVFRPGDPSGRAALEDAVGHTLDDRPVVGFVGHFEPRKDHETFLNAIARVREQMPSVAAVLVGGALESVVERRRAALRGRIAELGLEANVSLVGQRQDMAPIIAGFDVGVLASHSEGLGNAILEYMALGKPVVATRVGGIPDAVIDGTTGFLVQPRSAEQMADRILQLIGDGALRARMGTAGRCRVESEFSLDRWVTSMAHLYHEHGDRV